MASITVRATARFRCRASAASMMGQGASPSEVRRTAGSGTVLLLFGGVAQDVRLHPARVQPFEEEVDDVALAGALHARYENDAGLLGRGKIALGLQERLAHDRRFLLPRLLVDFDTQLGGFEHGLPPGKSP